MKRAISLLLTAGLIFGTPVLPAGADYERSYEHYLRRAIEALQNARPKEAFVYLETAHMIDPSRPEAIRYLDLLPPYSLYSKSFDSYYQEAENASRRGREDEARFYYRVASMIDPRQEHLRYYPPTKFDAGPEEDFPFVRSSERIEDPVPEPARPKKISRTRQVVKDTEIARRPSLKTPTAEPVSEPDIPEETITEKILDSPERKTDLDYGMFGPSPRTESSGIEEYEPVQKEASPPSVKPAESRASRPPRQLQNVPDEIELNAELWQNQPDMVLNLWIGKSYVMRGEGIERFLVLTEGIVEVSRLSRDRIKIDVLKRGVTFMHVWDAKGRWTFHLRTELEPSPDRLSREEAEDITLVHEDPFEFHYSNNWSAGYSGPDFENLKRRNLRFRQWFGLSGPSPYGFWDGSFSTYKFDTTTEIVTQTIGLSGGDIGPLKDFNLRVWDSSARFSNLSLPSRSFRGVHWQHITPDRSLAYTVLRGQDRAQYLFVSPDVFDVRKSYLEGARVTLFPEGEHAYSFNYARGWGEARPEDFKDKVFSVDTRHNLGDWIVRGEVGYDEDVTSSLLMTELRKEYYGIRMNFRDIDKDYRTITGTPADRGETGAFFSWDWTPDKYRFSAQVDLYQNDEIENPGDPNNVNIDSVFSFDKTIDDSSRYSSTLYYFETPQLISPRRSTRWRNYYSKRFDFWNGRLATWNLSQTVQSNRYKRSATSDFDRLSAGTGIRLPLWKALSWYADYEISRVNDISNDEQTWPRVFQTGLNSSHQLTDKLTGYWSLNYRDEEETGGNFSFLSGEDQVQASMSLTYRPRRGTEFFLDGLLREVWMEDSDRPGFHEADIRMGMRSSWDTFFSWSPKGKVVVSVFRDANADGHEDPDDVGLGGLKVFVGNDLLPTGSDGGLVRMVRAKEVLVRLDESTIPAGFIPTTPLETRLKIQKGGVQKAAFGFTNRSRISGVVYEDVNENSRPDSGDRLFSQVRVSVDGNGEAVSNFKGEYRFDSLEPGPHMLRLDVNTLPPGYLPRVAPRQELNLREGESLNWNIPLMREE